MRIFEKFKQAASCKGEGFKRVKFGEGRKYGRKEGKLSYAFIIQINIPV